MASRLPTPRRRVFVTSGVSNTEVHKGREDRQLSRGTYHRIIRVNLRSSAVRLFPLRLCVRFSVHSKDVIGLVLQNKRGSPRNGDG